ncbi:MAG: DNA-binding protein Alba [Candidatus Aenigmatarchaeota archaeon]
MSEKAAENVIFVGKKPLMVYVLSVMTQFSNGQDEIMLKARGKSVGKAVDIAEIVRNKFLTNASVKNIKIGTEQIVAENKDKFNVSTIEITMKK